MHLARALVVIYGFLLSIFPLLGSPLEGFVQRDGNRLHVNGNSFYFNGANQYYIFYKSQKMTNDVLEDASSLGLNVLRTWAFCDGEWHDGHSLQPSPRTYNEATFRNLDYAIFRAEQLGIRLIFSLVNNWDAFGGMNAYVKWSNSAREHDDFYSDPETKSIFKDYIKYVLNRTNTYTGRKYKDEPAIMMWELANEPRIAKNRINQLYSWIDEMASFIKSEDPNHLVSTGSEGELDADIYQAHKSDAIDVVSFHLYPEDWNLSYEKSLAYIERHIRVAKQELKKPVYCGEFGIRNKAQRESTYRAWYQKYQSLGADGALFWILSGRQDDGSFYPDYDGFTLYYPESGSILDLVQNHSEWTKKQSGKALDFIPPEVELENLKEDSTIKGTFLIKARAIDNQNVKAVTVNLGGVERPMSFDGEYWTYLWNTLEKIDGLHKIKVTAKDDDDNEAQITQRIEIQNKLADGSKWELLGKKEQDDGYNFVYYIGVKKSADSSAEGNFKLRFYARLEGPIKIGPHYEQSDVYVADPKVSPWTPYLEDLSFFEVDLGFRKVEPGRTLGFKGQLNQGDGQLKSANDWSAASLGYSLSSIKNIVLLQDDVVIAGDSP